MQTSSILSALAIWAVASVSPSFCQSLSELDAFARDALEELQALSLTSGREYCSMIGLDPDGELVVSEPRRGWRASCRPRDPEDAEIILASLHTHGTHSPRFDSEMPSSDDMVGDMDEGIWGYIATPGGRIWRLDGETGTGRQLCGTGCLIADPDYDAEDHDPIPRRVTLDTLFEREADD